MKLLFTPNGWQDYVSWLPGEPFKGIGKPEPLRGELAGWWSRRLTAEHRVVYRVRGTGAEQLIEVATCRGHY